MTDARQTRASRIDHAARVLSTALCAVVAALLGWLAISVGRAPGLAAAVDARMTDAGVSSRVTAVLLDFRGYDTLIEIAVLVAAVLAIWSLERGRPALPPAIVGADEPVLTALVRTVVPLIVLVAAYLVWRGAYAPGGAFQGGALLGGAIVLVLAAGVVGVGDRTRAAAKYAVGAGLLVFTGIAIATLLARGGLLDYPPAAAYALILTIEAALALSIAATLADLFVDVPSVRRTADEAES
jgi:multisubunit Na+/H+ antiporter MnhB subunit